MWYIFILLMVVDKDFGCIGIAVGALVRGVHLCMMEMEEEDQTKSSSKNRLRTSPAVKNELYSLVRFKLGSTTLQWRQKICIPH